MRKPKRPGTITKGKKYPVAPHQESGEHHSLCPVCGVWVDELDLEEVMQHIDPDHQAPRKY
jgi:hypothetical protein